MTTTYGTANFVSKATAIRYYQPYFYENTAVAVEQKIAEGEIFIGPPKVKPGETLSIIDDGTRYAVTEGEGPAKSFAESERE